MILQLKGNKRDEVYDGFVIVDGVNGRRKRHTGQYASIILTDKETAMQDIGRFLSDAIATAARVAPTRYSQNEEESDGTV